MGTDADIGDLVSSLTGGETAASTEKQGTVDFDATDIDADRPKRGPDGKFKPKSEAAPAEEPAAPAQEEPAKEPAAEPEPAPPAVDAKRLAAVLRKESAAEALRADAEKAIEQVKAAQKETAELFRTVKADREKHAAERAEFERYVAQAKEHPIAFLQRAGVDLERVVHMIAEGKEDTLPPEPKADPAAEKLAALEAEIRRLREEPPEWAKKQREEEARRTEAVSQREAEEGVLTMARGTTKSADGKLSPSYPAILDVLDESEIVPNFVAIARGIAAKNAAIDAGRASGRKITLDDSTVLAMLESSCQERIERIKSKLSPAQPKTPQAASATDSRDPSNRPGRSVTSEVTGVRASTTPKSRAERLADFDREHFEIVPDRTR